MSSSLNLLKCPDALSLAYNNPLEFVELVAVFRHLRFVNAVKNPSLFCVCSASAGGFMAVFGEFCGAYTGGNPKAKI